MLTIVDMQPHFFNARSPALQDEIVLLIEEAKRNNSPILFLRYATFGAVASRLLDAVKDYDEVYHTDKNHDNGSPEVLEVLDYCRLKPAKISVCGINTGACVLKTARGIAIKRPNIIVEVIARGCNQALDTVWAQFHRTDIPNLVTVPPRTCGVLLDSLEVKRACANFSKDSPRDNHHRRSDHASL